MRLIHFRCFKTFEVGNFHSRLNVIVGKNAQGKTSLLESLSLITQLKSFRTHTSAELIQEGQTQASVQALVIDPTITWISIGLEGNRKEIRIEDKKIPSRSRYDFLGSGISFIPDDLYLLKGGPEARRNFFDELCITMNSAYDLPLHQFQRVLKQRNRLIKAIREGKSSIGHLSLWTDQFIEAAFQVYQIRTELVERCAQILPSIYRNLFGVQEELKIHYETGFPKLPPSLDEIAERIGRLGEAEIAAGYSLVGPHRDDYRFYLEGREARAYASQGQTRGIVIALKVTQMELAQKSKTGVPLLLLDDIISELDESRVQALVSYLANYPGQMFVTTAETSKLKTLHQEFSGFQIIDLENELQKRPERPLNLS